MVDGLWKPIEKMPKSVREGYMRVFTFKPVNEGRTKLIRAYKFDKTMGYRECDAFIDIPIYEEPQP